MRDVDDIFSEEWEGKGGGVKLYILYSQSSTRDHIQFIHTHILIHSHPIQFISRGCPLR